MTPQLCMGIWQQLMWASACYRLPAVGDMILDPKNPTHVLSVVVCDEVMPSQPVFRLSSCLCDTLPWWMSPSSHPLLRSTKPTEDHLNAQVYFASVAERSVAKPTWHDVHGRMLEQSKPLCRAYFKLAEALLVPRLLPGGDTSGACCSVRGLAVLDIGAAPGGWSQCLLVTAAHHSRQIHNKYYSCFENKKVVCMRVQTKKEYACVFKLHHLHQDHLHLRLGIACSVTYISNTPQDDAGASAAPGLAS